MMIHKKKAKTMQINVAIFFKSGCIKIQVKKEREEHENNITHTKNDSEMQWK